MSQTSQIVKELVKEGEFRFSNHGEEELSEDEILPAHLLQSLATAVVVEDYPDAWKGPTVLLLQEFEGRKFHAIWGLSKATPDVATLVTAYVPDPKKWTGDLMRRLKR